jgi:cell division protease FtsH
MNGAWRRSGIIYIIILLAGVAMAVFLFSNSDKLKELKLSEVITMSQQHQIKEISVDGQWLNVTETSGEKIRSYKGDTGLFEITGLDLTGITYEVTPSGFDWGSLLLGGLLPLVIIVGGLFFLLSRVRGVNNQAMNFGRSRARLTPPSKPSVTFGDVAGVDEAKVELQEVVDFLKSRERFQALGARIPRGVLLVGPPGTGKTLLARAVAGEAGVPFFSISGSEFVEMFVGVGAARVRDLFDQAKHQAPCIVFVDEIDAVGRHRGAGLGGSHDEREQTLNQILTEMDGFDTNTSVIVLAATNRPDILDPALLRPGRFDRRVVLDRPDVNGRVEILKVHAKNKPLAPDVNLEVLGRQTAGFSGADLANLMNESAITAGRRNKKAIEMIDLEDSIDKVLLGPERKSRRISPKEKEITAYHEGGHALVAKMLPEADPPRKISIIPRGMAGGYTKSLEEDRSYWSRSKILAGITVFMAGMAAEKIIFNEVTTGAQDDIKRATEMARRMVTDFGMSERLGPRTFGDKQEMVFLGREISEQRDYGDKVADVIDEEVNRIIQDAHAQATEILMANKDTLIRLAKTLVVEETLEADRLEAVFKGPDATPGTPTPTQPASTGSEAQAKAPPEPRKAPPVINPFPKQAPAG